MKVTGKNSPFALIFPTVLACDIATLASDKSW